MFFFNSCTKLQLIIYNMVQQLQYLKNCVEVCFAWEQEVG